METKIKKSHKHAVQQNEIQKTYEDAFIAALEKMPIIPDEKLPISNFKSSTPANKKSKNML